MQVKTLEKDGQTYYNMNGLAVKLGRTRQSVNRMIHQGLVEMVYIGKTRWYRVAPGYEMVSQMVSKITPMHFWRSAYEIAEIEGISEQEVNERTDYGVYRYAQGKFRFLEDWEWDAISAENMKVIKDRGWENAKRGRKYAVNFAK